MPGRRFTKKTQRQVRSSVRIPPSVGPIVGPSTTARAKSDWLTASFAGGNVSRMICCAGTINPPPNAPCTNRSAISVVASFASPHNTDVTVNPAMESAK